MIVYSLYHLILSDDFLNDKFVFYNFYITFVKIAENMLLDSCKENVIFLSNKMKILEDFELKAFKKIADCSIRMLIMEMNFCKMEGNLKGDDPESEYRDYLNNWLKNKKYFWELLYAYPALTRLLIDVLNDLVDFYTGILENYSNDKEDICKVFNIKTSKITYFNVGGSDSHTHGKSVAIIAFDDGHKLVYKPHSLEAEIRYQEFLQWLGDKTALGMKFYKIIDRKSHGWEEFVTYTSCVCDEELKKYYMRLGLIICANYMLNVYDVHNENIIASGAYPVVIDAETLLKNLEPFNHDRIAEVTLNEIRGTVMAQGILPQHMRRKNSNKSIDLSGMSNDVGMEYPHKVLQLINVKRSDMKCVYEYPKEVKKKNLPTLKTEVKRPIYYMDYILEGFDNTYKFVLDNKSLVEEKYNIFKNLRLRHLRRDTQTYGMLLTTSKHPDFLGDCINRQMILMALYKNRDIKNTREVSAIEDEILQLLYNDIPIFYYDSNGHDLFSGYGNCIKGYFERTALDLIKAKLGNMNNNDLLQQKLYIVLAVSSTEDVAETKTGGDKWKEKPLFFSQNHQRCLNKESIYTQCMKIAQRLIDNALYNSKRTKVGWIGVSLEGLDEVKWNVVPLNYDLYNGIGGIAIFVHAIYETFQNNKYAELCTAIDSSLDEYMQAILEYDIKIGTEDVSGYFTGECSLINVFLILFKITSKIKYINKAEKLYRIISNQITNNKDKAVDNDIVSGLAGTIIILLKLYHFTGKIKYIDMADKAGKRILKAAKKGNIGIGWNIPGQPFILAGLSHGASGIALALMELGKISGKQEYIKAAESAIYEEDSLFSQKCGNWVDRRIFRGTTGEQDGRNPITWCHGSAGILLARIKIYPLASPHLKGRIRNDILKASTSLKEQGWKKNQCLCHGNIGNLEIMYEYAKFAGDYELEEKSDCALQDAMDKASDYWDCGLLPNYEHLGFMLGISGIGYSLLRHVNKELPCIIALE